MTSPSSPMPADARASTSATHLRSARRRLVLVALSALGIDAASKVWASTSLRGDPVHLGPLALRLVHNRGVAFGVGSFLPSSTLIVLTMAIAAGALTAAWTGRLEPPLATGLIVGGAVANVADRLTAGSVVDFIDIGRWPVFNLADVAVVCGLALLLFCNRSSAPVGESAD